MSRPIPSKEELIALMHAKVTEARASLQAASETLPLSSQQREEYEQLMKELDELQRRIQALK